MCHAFAQLWHASVAVRNAVRTSVRVESSMSSATAHRHWPKRRKALATNLASGRGPVPMLAAALIALCLLVGGVSGIGC